MLDILKKNILQWIEFHNRWDPKLGHHILSKRICNLLGNISFFYEIDESFQKLLKSLNKQAIHLLTSLEIKKRDDKIFIPKAIIISSLCFTNMKPKLGLGLKF